MRAGQSYDCLWLSRRPDVLQALLRLTGPVLLGLALLALQGAASSAESRTGIKRGGT